MSQNIENVAVSVNRALDSKNKTLGSLENMSAVSEETAAGVEQVSASTQEQMAGAEELSNLAKIMDEMAKELQYAVATFKIE